MAKKAVVEAKWLDRRPCNLEVLSSNPLGARAFFYSSSSINGVLNQVPQERSIFAVFPISRITLAVLPNANLA